MDRLTLNNIKDMGMWELAHNCCYIKDGLARYRDFELDIDARELAGKLLKDYAEDDGAYESEEGFDDWMVDCLQYGIDTIEGVIALFYRNLWAMADLHENLRKYEDTGLTPEQIKEIDTLFHEKCVEVSSYKAVEGKTYYGKQLYVKETE